MTVRKLWIGLALTLICSFAVLIFFGTDIYRKLPPIPGKVVDETGNIDRTEGM